jgi:hypothetical protein
LSKLPRNCEYGSQRGGRHALWGGVRFAQRKVMELGYNRNAHFTKWVVSAGLLTEPFVLIDVGVQDGEHLRWRALGDCLVVHGFDPIEEGVQKLVEANGGRPNRHYHCMALGNTDGEATLYFNPANPTTSSMYQQGVNRFDIERSEDHRTVPIRLPCSQTASFHALIASKPTSRALREMCSLALRRFCVLACSGCGRNEFRRQSDLPGEPLCNDRGNCTAKSSRGL